MTTIEPCGGAVRRRSETVDDANVAVVLLAHQLPIANFY